MSDDDKVQLMSARLAAKQLYRIRTDTRVDRYIPFCLCRFNDIFAGEERRRNIKYVEKFIDLLIDIENSHSDYEIHQLRLKMDDRMDWLEHLYDVVKEILALGPEKEALSLKALYNEALVQISLENAHYAC